ncbi:Imm42 family immunity protein [Pseudomonas sp. dw_358]|uniref:Imm42 family immunity protein n=1 Tax=Pseudomonas sp. dw_358 TaxID=2720083 RepID=UPI001BD66DB6|nr:Imm42 family immunity protein [Pseudomonas sp. dw_358]
MKIFGDINEFAIEYSLNDQHGGSWLFGQVCYWIAGERVGDFPLGTSLRDVLIQMQNVIDNCGKRQLDNMVSKSPQELFDAIDSKLYGGVDVDNNSDESVESFYRFDIRIPVDVFDGCKMYLFESSGFELILYKKSLDGLVNEKRLSAGYFDAVIRSFYEEVLEIYKNNK